jgi:hypothetical protein
MWGGTRVARRRRRFLLTGVMLAKRRFGEAARRKNEHLSPRRAHAPARVRARLRAAHCAEGSSPGRSNAGFSLIELIIAVGILPLVIGAIVVGTISVFSLQASVSNSLTGSGDEQVVSANFVGDVQGSQWITTFSSPTTTCGTGTLVFSLSPDNVPVAQITNVISYVKVPQASGSNDTLFRNVCQAGTEKTSTAISHNVPSSQQVAIQPASVQTAAATGWVAAQGATSVNLSISEPPTNYLYSLSAVPRLVAAPSSGPNAPVSPVLPFELLGGGSGTCTPPPTLPDLTIGGTTTIEVGSAPNWNGAIGVASPCAGSISMPRSGTLKGTISTANPNLNSVSAGGGAVYPTSETYVPGGITDPFSSLAPPSNPSTSGLGVGSCSGSGPYTCSTGLYSASPSPLSVNTAVITFDPSTAPNPNVIVFNQPVTIHNSEQVTFEGGSPVSQVTYWFRGGLTTSGASSVTFGPATYIFGDSSSPPASALSIGNGSTISANNDQGVLFYVEAGPASFSGNTSTPIAGASLYDGIALWDASTSPITIANSSSITGFGGVYDSSPSCGAVACVQFSGNVPFAAYFLIAYTMSSPSGSATIQITG